VILFIIIYLNGCDAEYVVSGARYVLFEDYGPAPATLVTPATFLLFSAWPVVIGAVSLVYSGKYLFSPTAFSTAARLFSDSDEYLSPPQVSGSVNRYGISRLWFQSKPLHPPHGAILNRNSRNYATRVVLDCI
jgi:Pheromone A receptor